MKHIEKAVHAFMDNEDIDEANEALRDEVQTIEELRFAVALARQQYSDEAEDLIDTLVSI